MTDQTDIPDASAAAENDLQQDPNTSPLSGEIIGLVAKAKALDPATITPSSNFDELGIDSLDKINLTFEIEDLYRIAIPDDSLGSLRTVGDVIRGVARLQREQHATA